MGGRGASSATARSKGYVFEGKLLKYGDEYKTLTQLDNIKFIQRKSGNSGKAPYETQTPGRIYVTIKNNSVIHSIAFMGSDGKRYKMIDFAEHNGLQEHAHDEYTYKGGVRFRLPQRGEARRLSSKERQMVAKVKQHWSGYVYNKP